VRSPKAVMQLLRELEKCSFRTSNGRAGHAWALTPLREFITSARDVSAANLLHEFKSPPPRACSRPIIAYGCCCCRGDLWSVRAVYIRRYRRVGAASGFEKKFPPLAGVRYCIVMLSLGVIYSDSKTKPNLAHEYKLFRVGAHNQNMINGGVPDGRKFSFLDPKSVRALGVINWRLSFQLFVLI
jgi:hypothetical protein